MNEIILTMLLASGIIGAVMLLYVFWSAMASIWENEDGKT